MFISRVGLISLLFCVHHILPVLLVLLQVRGMGVCLLWSRGSNVGLRRDLGKVGGMIGLTQCLILALIVDVI